MPARTNPRQAIVYYVKQHLVPQGFSVTESKSLPDTATGGMREVDIVVEGKVAGDEIIISFEVVDYARPATVEWVERMIGKHRTMPTNRLVLVSWSGFTRAAIAKAQSESGRVQTITPEELPDGSAPTLFLESFVAVPRHVTIRVVDDDGSMLSQEGLPLDLDFYDRDGALQGGFRGVSEGLLADELLRQRLAELAHENEDKASITEFSVEQDGLAHVGAYVRRVDDGHLFALDGFTLWGSFRVEQVPLTFDVMRLGETVFAHGKARMLERQALFVATPTSEPGETQISWRMI
jgi:hypothetical protein